eukprot:4068754-Alexandrium_andersonii.AAC.1
MPRGRSFSQSCNGRVFFESLSALLGRLFLAIAFLTPLSEAPLATTKAQQQRHKTAVGGACETRLLPSRFKQFQPCVLELLESAWKYLWVSVTCRTPKAVQRLSCCAFAVARAPPSFTPCSSPSSLSSAEPAPSPVCLADSRKFLMACAR